MKTKVRLAPVLFISASVFLMAAELHSPQLSGLTVHEWGTFTSVAGEDGSATDWDALGCKNDLPRFVNEFGYRGFKWRLTGTVRMETPVMYFYSARELDAHVKVAFRHGLITEWYPRATKYEVYQKNGVDGSVRRLEANLNGIDTSMRSLTGGIEWRDVKVQPDSAPALPVESGPSHYYAARETDASPIMVGGQHEKFLFYRGVGRFQVPLSARFSGDGQIVVENRGVETVPNVILFENRGGRLGYRSLGPIDAGQTARPSAPRPAEQLRNDLETALVAQGLFPKEAQAMVETWRDSWFEEGSRLIYIVPSRAIDAILPLQIEPAPSQTARVFVGRIELISPETKRSVEEAIANNDWSTMDRYGRFLDPILKLISSENPSSVNQIEQLRRKIQASTAGGRCR